MEKSKRKQRRIRLPGSDIITAPIYLPSKRPSTSKRKYQIKHNVKHKSNRTAYEYKRLGPTCVIWIHSPWSTNLLSWMKYHCSGTSLGDFMHHSIKFSFRPSSLETSSWPADKMGQWQLISMLWIINWIYFTATACVF